MKEISENQKQQIIVVKASCDSGFCERCRQCFRQIRHEEGCYRYDERQKHKDIEKTADQAHNAAQQRTEDQEWEEDPAGCAGAEADHGKYELPNQQDHHHAPASAERYRKH